MVVAVQDFPRSSVIDRHWIDNAWFKDSYRTRLSRPEASVIDIFEAVFGHHPQWMKQVLHMRNALAARAGLDVPPADDIAHFVRKPEYRVGDTIGPWPIFALTDNELVVGRDNSHLDFRLSILKTASGESMDVTISTVCRVHNAFGKVYLLGVIPFHKQGVKWLIRRAVEAGRL